MLTKTQKEYLQNLPRKRAHRIVSIQPYDPRSAKIAEKIRRQIHTVLPGVRVYHRGSSGLKIAGLPDIDLFIQPKTDVESYKKKLMGVLPGTPQKNKWDWIEDGLIRVTVKIVEPNQKKAKERTRFFHILKKNSFLTKKYEEVKQSMDGMTFKKYYETKLDFESRIISLFTKENQRNLQYLKTIGAASNTLHIALSPQRHGLVSFATSKLLKHHRQFRHIARTIAYQFKDEKIDMVVGPQSVGDTLATDVAHYLSKINKRTVHPIHMEKNAHHFRIKKQGEIPSLAKKRILIVDDTTKSGKTLMNLAQYFSTYYKSYPIGMAVICARNNIPPVIPETVKFYAFLVQDDEIFSYNSKDCLLCKKRVPFSKTFVIAK